MIKKLALSCLYSVRVGIAIIQEIVLHFCLVFLNYHVLWLYYSSYTHMHKTKKELVGKLYLFIFKVLIHLTNLN